MAGTPTEGERTRHELERALVFLGRATHTLDEKGRVVMPSAYRAELKDGLVATRGKDGQISVLTNERFREIAEQEIDKPRTRDARRQARGMFTVAEQTKLDSQGRLLLSHDLRKHAGLLDADEVIVAGVYDAIEIWHPDTFAEEDAVSSRLYRDDEEVPGF